VFEFTGILKMFFPIDITFTTFKTETFQLFTFAEVRLKSCVAGKHEKSHQFIAPCFSIPSF